MMNSLKQRALVQIDNLSRETLMTWWVSQIVFMTVYEKIDDAIAWTRFLWVMSHPKK